MATAGSLRETLSSRPLVVVAVAAALEAIAAAILIPIVGWEHLVDGISIENARWFALCLGGQVVAYAGYTVAHREVVTTGGGPDVAPVDAAAIVAAGFAPVLSVDAAGGFSVDRVAFRKLGLGEEQATARVVALNVLEYAVLAPVVAVCGVLVFLGVGGHAGPGMTLPWLLVVPGLAAAAWATAPARRERLGDARGGGALRRALAHAVAGAAIVRELLCRRDGVVALAGAALYWGGDILTLWSALYAFGIDLPVPALIVAFGTGYALTRRGLPAGGPGAVELLLPLALEWVHIRFGAAFIGVFIYRFFNFWLPLPLGLVAASRLERLRSRGGASLRARAART